MEWWRKGRLIRILKWTEELRGYDIALAASRWLAPLEAACEGETGAAAVPPLDAGVQEPMPLRATADLYSGLAIDQASLAEDPEAFDKQLEKALAEWKAAGKKAVWVTIPSRLVGLIPVAAARGFEFHNAEAGKGAMMVAWLPGGEHNLPQPCTHYVGVGVAVVDAQGRILVVQEKAGPAAARGKDFWKGVTGSDVTHSRQVWEETGIRVRFEGVISFRQQHKAGVRAYLLLLFPAT
ncbi:hypothetical protein T484DRAFT_1857146 [Baffinella frigidus]|nr:hypothetical protein T484DRAFT_1857146 [Cryptophyta sp. CCMP2293]